MSGIGDRRRRRPTGDSDLVGRMQLYGGERDLHETLGYKDSPDVSDFWVLYNRADIAKAIVDKPAEATWSEGVTIHGPDADTVPPDRGEDDLHGAFESMKRKNGVVSSLVRADMVARVGRHGVMLLGVNDGRSLKQPLGSATELKYVTPLSERRIAGFELGENPTNERYNKPMRWTLDFEDENREVHWSRVIHIAEQQREHAVYAVPILRPVYNRILDWQKVIGGSAEMFWRGADRKIVASMDPDMGPVDDTDKLRQQVEEMNHGLRNTVFARGLGIDQLDGEDVDPSGVADTILDAIASETDIPKRILIGSERGELASTQDRANFYGNMEDRRRQHAGPGILRPFVNRLQRADILPEGDFEIHWPELFVLDAMEKADIQAKRANAVKRLDGVGWIDDDEKRELVGLSD